MENKQQLVLGKTWEEWEREYPVVKDIRSLKETVWINPDKIPCEEAVKNCQLTMEDVLDASRRLERFAPYFAKAFPETAPAHGIIESPLKRIPKMKEALEAWDERKRKARILGETAATKLLFPMLLMLAVVMAVIMIPAFLSFYG